MQGQDLAEGALIDLAGEIPPVSPETRSQQEGSIEAVQIGQKKGQDLKCLRQRAINAAKDAKFLSSQEGTSLFIAVIVLEIVILLNQERDPIHLPQNWSR